MTRNQVRLIELTQDRYDYIDAEGLMDVAKQYDIEVTVEDCIEIENTLFGEDWEAQGEDW